MLIFGVEENRKIWIDFRKSFLFEGYQNLRWCCFYQLCNKISLLFSGRKRKRDELKKNDNSKHLSRKVILHLTKLQEKASDQISSLCATSLISLLMHQKEEKVVGQLVKRSQAEVLQVLKIIEMYPLASLEPEIALGIVTLLLVILVEEGGLNGRREVVCLVLHLLNRFSNHHNLNNLFCFHKRIPYFMLIWFLNQGQQHESITLEDCHLNIVLERREPSEFGDLVGGFLYLVGTLTSFLVNNMLNQAVIYTKELVLNPEENSNITEMKMLFSLILGVHLKQVSEKVFVILNLWLLL